jgi:hypothetical protein
MQLIDKQGRAVKIGEWARDFRGDLAKVTGIYEPGTRSGGNGGRVEVDELGHRALYFPGVYGFRFVK